MEEVLNSLSGFSVTSHENSPHAEHPRFSLYKVKGTGSTQQERRKRILAARKEARYDVLCHLRQIEESSPGDEDQASDSSMECEQEERKLYSRPKKYKNFLMLSEWLVDVPEDFQNNYLVVPCPVGKRSLVVAAGGKTRVYSKSGIMVNQFPSLLPGGSLKTLVFGYALLDCIWSDARRTFYILDLIVWMNQSIMECETDFRFEWLKTRMAEVSSGAKEISKLNPYRFLPLPYTSCSSEAISKLITEPMPFEEALDGLLFYHRESHYTHGPTPLVGWLKAYMLPEILGVSVPQNYIAEMPAKYVNLQTHIKYGDEMRKRTRRNYKKMEVKTSKPEKKKVTADGPSSKEHLTTGMET